MPAAQVEIAHTLVIHSHEHGVRFDRKDDVDLCLGLEAIRKLARHTIGVLRVPQPNIIRQKREPRRSQTACIPNRLLPSWKRRLPELSR